MMMMVMMITTMGFIIFILLPANHCTVICMSVIGSTLYVFTSFGCLLGINSAAMTCTFMCRISSEESPSFCAILPLCQFTGILPDPHSVPHLEKEGRESILSYPKVEKCLFATIMPGYRSLKDAVISSTSTNSKDDSAVVKSGFCISAWSDDIFRQPHNGNFHQI